SISPNSYGSNHGEHLFNWTEVLQTKKMGGTKAKPIDIEKILPIYKVENNAIVSVFGDITVAYEVALPEIFSLSNNEYESFHQAWVKAIRALPKHSCFHKQDWFIKDAYDPDFES